MKSLNITVAFLMAIAFGAFGQSYRVSKVLGSISFNGKLLTKDDVVTGLDKLTASSANAAIRLVSGTAGAVVINFVYGKKVTNAVKTEKSELYELVVQDYLNKYTTFKNTQTKGVPFPEFDWYRFFYQYPDTGSRRMLIIEGEKVPLQSQVFKTSKTYKILASCFTTKQDSTTQELTVRQDSIVFPSSTFSTKGDCYLDIYLSYKNNKGEDKTLKITKRPINIFYLTKDQLTSLIDLFHDNVRNGYQNAQDAKSDFYTYIEFNYGRYYEPLISSQLNKFFK